MSYIWFAWATAFFYGLSGVVGKIVTKRKAHIGPWTYNFVWVFLYAVFSLPFVPLFHVGLPTGWMSMTILGIVSAVSGTLYILALYRNDISILGPLYSFRTPIAVLLGLILFGEKMNLWQTTLIVIITLAGMFVSMDERMSWKTFFQKNIAIALLAVTASAVYNAGIKHASVDNGYWELVVWSNILTFVFVLPTLPLCWKELNKTPIGDYKGIAISTLLGMFGGLTAFMAFKENISISTAIVSLPLGLVMTIFLSVWMPKLLEKHPWKVYVIRFAAASVMFAAALGLSK